MRVFALVSSCLVVAVAGGATARADELVAAVGSAAPGGPLAVPTVATPPSLAPAATWEGAANVALAYDVSHGRAITEPTRASIENDGSFIYVHFSAEQREPIAAAQRTNDSGGGSDDEVGVDLWPNDSGGFFYQFLVTPNGTHYESSSENSNYQPTWQSAGGARPGGYDVAMRIPLASIRGVHGGTWRMQFVRIVHATGETQVWRYGSEQQSADSLTYAGSAVFGGLSATSRPQPRLALYGLGAVAAPVAGGSTSRAGADLSLPITATTSLIATVHPDFSNVELDQQSISPTAFARYYSEVRPFFTQGANFYNNFNCDVCSSITELYTPAIPTPRRGYAIEGQQGLINLATFDAIGDGRSDLASAASYITKDRHWHASAQRVSVTTPGLVDDTTTTGLSWSDQKRLSGYFDYGSDQGTLVTQGNLAQRYDFGGGYGTQTFALFGSTRKVGDQYQPADGFVQHPGIAGFALYSNKIWLLKGHSILQSIALGGLIDRYQGRTHGFNQTDNEVLLDVLTKSSIDAQISIGSDYLRVANDAFLPISQNGVSVTYHSGSQQNAGNFGQHGSAAYPVNLTYYTGRYGAGRLDTWLRSASLRAGDRGILSLELDSTDQRFSGPAPNVQWFERGGYTYQLGSDTSLAFGVRKVVGFAPTPSGGGNCAGTCTNLSFSFHQKSRRAEIYAGYGDASTLVTTPQALVKFIYYLGAEKGS